MAMTYRVTQRPLGCTYALNQPATYDASSLLATPRGSKTKGRKWAGLLSLLTPKIHEWNSCLLPPRLWSLLVQRTSFLKRQCSHRGTRHLYIKLENEGVFALLWHVNQMGTKNEIIFLAGVIDLDYQGGIGLLYTTKMRKMMSQNAGNLPGSLFLFPRPVIKVNRTPHGPIHIRLLTAQTLQERISVTTS